MKSRHPTALFFVLVSFLGAGSLPADEETARTINRIATGGPGLSEATATWNIVLSTGEHTFRPLDPKVRDFAHFEETTIEEVRVSASPIENVSTTAPLWDGAVFRNPGGELLPSFWTAPVPATYTVVFDKPFELRWVSLEGFSRVGGFADFEVRVVDADLGSSLAPEVVEATAAAGLSRNHGFKWTLGFEPRRVREVSVVFERGTIALPKQVFLGDLDLWGIP